MKTFLSNEINIPIEGRFLKGILSLPDMARGMVIFSHGSGSSRLSPRNTFVANALNNNNFATLLFDLLTEEEDTVYENRFNINLLTERLIKVTQWIQNQDFSTSLPIGYFGASTGAACALRAAAGLGSKIRAVISRGGRPDLAGDEELALVTAPTLLIVGGWDEVVIALNRKALEKMNNIKKLLIVPMATHLFVELGKLEQVTNLSVAWFREYLTK